MKKGTGKKGTVVLAFSGGLDTSVCIPLLREKYGYGRVITVAVDVGQPESDIRDATEKGRRFADAHYTIDAKDRFVEEYVFPSLQANGSYEGYPLGTALARPLIAGEAVAIARSSGAKAVAHGCTGKGNDQLRFDFVIRSSGLEVVAPIRELNLTRSWEIEYARKHKIPVTVAKKNPYSVDENCWNRSIEGGRLEDPAFHPPESIYRWTVDPRKAPDSPEEVTVRFEKGIPVALDGKRMKGIDLVQEMNLRAGRNGVGRNDMIEDRILGLKAREVYEHPAATALSAAHADLEHLVLTRAELAFKRSVDDRWSDLAYQGLVHEPLFAALSAFIRKTQERVNGIVDLVLYRGSVRVAGRSSPDAIYSGEMVSFDSMSLDQGHAEGVSRFHGIQAQILKKKREG
ncbi:MAG TPA: argininosuccinate synthase [Methanomicrobiales archaeon]|nr:argininosuccinate synthase [Methanomicrobiales archaeon]